MCSSQNNEIILCSWLQNAPNDVPTQVEMRNRKFGLTDNDMPCTSDLPLLIFIESLLDVLGHVSEVLELSVVLALVCILTHINDCFAHILIHVGVGESRHD